MPRTQHYTPDQVIKAIQQTRGLLTITAKVLRCRPETIYNYVKRYPAVARAAHDAREAMTDLAEQKLFEAIDAGESWAIQFYLKSQGRSRGYIERHEVRIEVEKVAAKLADEFGMTPDDIITEAEAYLAETAGV